MTRAALAALLSHWRQHPGQALTLVLGLALATALWAAVQAINAEARAQYARAAAALDGSVRAVITAPQGLTLPDYARLRRAGWPVTPVLEGRIGPPGDRITLLGVDLVGWPGAQEIGAQAIGGEAPDDPAALLLPPGRLLADADTARRLRALPGASDLPDVILLPSAPPGIALTDIGIAERILQRPGQIDRLELTAPVPDHAPPLATLLPGARMQQPELPDTARLTDSFHLNLTAFGLLAFVVGLFVVHGMAGLAFEQRRTTFRTLRALGVPGPLLTRLVLAELAALALISAILGIVIGYLVAGALMPGVSASLRGLYGAEIGTGLSLRPGWVLGALAMALTGALTAGAQGLLKLRRLPILASGPDRWATATRTQLRNMALAGLACFAIGGLALAGSGLLSGFIAMGGVMLGAALILPLLLHTVLRALARRAGGPVSQWVWADMSAQVPGLSLALMALLLALATNIGVGTMVSSFRLTFTGWLDQRLAAEVYITARSPDQRARLESWLAPKVQALLPLYRLDTMLQGRPGRVYGIVDHATYRDHWPLIAALPAPWERLQAGAVLINEQLALRARLTPGDRVDLGQGWQAQVAGVYSDYGNPRAQAIAALPVLLARYPDLTSTQLGLRVAPEQTSALIADLRAAFDLPAEAIADQQQIRRASLAVFDRTFVVTGALNVLTLGVAAFAILTSLLALWSARLPQLAPLWALGLSRRHLAALDLLRSCALAALTAIFALPLGLALAWILLNVVNVRAFGWHLPLHLFPLDWIRLGGLAVLAGALAALWPARRLIRLPPARLLQVFAHDR